jgi:transcriptional regulator GlxA family with amidase domain
LAEAEPQLIVSDVVMPALDGFALCRRIRERPELDHLPLVLLTARADIEDRLDGLRHGADDYIGKPFDRRELAARVANLLERRRRLRERARTVGLTRLGEVSATPLDEAFLRRVLEAVDARLGDPDLTVASLAAGVAMSPRHLQRKLEALAGSSPQELIGSIRLARARELLERGAGNVTEVAFAVGFSDSSAFSRAFRRRFGLPPSEVAGGA